MMKKIRLMLTIGLFLLLVVQSVVANQIKLQSITVNVTDKERLQRGARLFMNYCSGCHSLKYVRYNRMAEDLGITTFDGRVDDDLLKNNLIFTQATIYDPILVAMPSEDAIKWFGMVPPDLSLTSRERGAAWIYTYLKSFYSDSARPFGTNNLLISDVAMPNILGPLIGKTILVQNKSAHLSYLLLIRDGEMFPIQSDDAVTDLVAFLVYVGDPSRLIRYRLGVLVIAFLCVLFFMAYRLNRLYWRQIKLNNSPK